MCAIKLEYWKDDTFSCDILDLHAIPMLKYRPVKKIDWHRAIEYKKMLLYIHKHSITTEF